MNALPRFSKAIRAGTALALLVPLLSACKDQQPTPLGEFRPDCPYEGPIRFRDSATLQIQEYDELVVPGKLTLTPEYHDCQRFVMLGASPSYGPLVAIFAADSLRQWIDSLEVVDQTQTSLVAMPLAQILSFDGYYPPLGIHLGHNCLYLWKKAAGYEAYMLPVPDQRQCGERHPPNALPAGGKSLIVQIRTKPDPPFGREDFPDVARWDRDLLGQQGIALGCAKAWCEIGPTGYAAVPSHDFPALPPADRRTVMMKGWYDEQPLAEVVSGTLQVSSVMGTIFPHPNLGSRTVNDYAATWTEAAYVTLSAPLAKYKTLLNLDPGDLPNRSVNRISLCSGSRNQCGVPDPPSGATTCNNGADPWWARIISVQQDTAFRCVIRRVHPGITIPGAVRWRWSLKDEVGWIRCPEGCCEMTGDS